ncbi:MAG TPA: hypothetical protein DCW55_01975 [Candidatus Pacebacteria bacterium]|nr:hypothetical protein [Candidatus Paceibacterota bacterium]
MYFRSHKTKVLQGLGVIFFLLVLGIGIAFSSGRISLDVRQRAATGKSDPVGWIDLVDQEGNVVGWALDPDLPADSIDIHVYIDGPAGVGTYVGSTTAGRARNDVNEVMKVSGMHGYYYQLPDSFFDGKTHTAFVHGIDLTGNVNQLLLPQTGATFTLPKKDTPTPSEIPVPTEVPGADERVLFHPSYTVDDNVVTQSFTTNAYGVTSLRYIDSRKLRMSLKAPDRIDPSDGPLISLQKSFPSFQLPNDYIVEVETKLDKSYDGNAWYIIVLNDQSVDKPFNDNAYNVGIHQNSGLYRISKMVNSLETEISNKRTDTIDPSYVNKIRIERKGDSIRLIINGIFVDEIQDNSYKGGVISLLAKGYASSYAVIEFNNFMVKEFSETSK